MERHGKTTTRTSKASVQIPYENDFEAQKQDGFAVLLLSSLKWQALEYETAAELEDLKKKVLGKRRKMEPNSTKSGPKRCGPSSNQNMVGNNINVVYHWPEIGMGSDGSILPELPPIGSLRSIIGECSKPFEKQLTRTDLEKTQNRLKFNKEYVSDALISILKESKDRLKVGIPVTVFNPNGEEYAMKFKRWEKAHILNGEWNNFVEKFPRPLEKNVDWVTVWLFKHRKNGEFCFAITSRRLDTKDLVKKSRKVVDQGKIKGKKVEGCC